MDTCDPWLRVAGTALAVVRGRHSPEGTLVSIWPLLVEAGHRLGVDFPVNLTALETLALPCLPLDPRCWALQDQAIAQDAARHGRKAGRPVREPIAPAVTPPSPRRLVRRPGVAGRLDDLARDLGDLKAESALLESRAKESSRLAREAAGEAADLADKAPRVRWEDQP